MLNRAVALFALIIVSVFSARSQQLPGVFPGDQQNTGGLQGPAGPGYGPATSTTSLTVGAGSQTLTTQSGLAYSAGAVVQLTCTSPTTYYMYGPVASYSGTTGTLVFNASSTIIGGAGNTCASWTLNLAPLNAASIPPYPFSFTNSPGFCIEAATPDSSGCSGAGLQNIGPHGQGTTAVLSSLVNASGVSILAGTDFTPYSNGDILVTFYQGVQTGSGQVSGGGSGAGVVYANPGTTGQVGCYLANGVVLSGCNPLPTGLTIPAPSFTGTPSAANATSFTLPNAGGAAPTSGGDCRYDTTQLRTVCGGDGALTGGIPRLIGWVHPPSDVRCAHGGDTSITFNSSGACNNPTGTEGTSAAEFASSVSIPANFMVQDKMLRVKAQLKAWSSTTSAALQVRMQWGSTTNYAANGPIGTTNGMVNRGVLMDCNIVSLAAPASSALQTADCNVPVPAWVAANWASTTVPGNVNTSSAEALSIGAYYSATGLFSATYTSGGTFSGTGNCTLGTFSAGTAGAATIAVASGTPGAITVTNTGYAFTGSTSTATLTGGTATCSGTPTLAIVLGGAQGNAIQLINMEVWEDN